MAVDKEFDDKRYDNALVKNMLEYPHEGNDRGKVGQVYPTGLLTTFPDITVRDTNRIRKGASFERNTASTRTSNNR